MKLILNLSDSKTHFIFINKMTKTILFTLFLMSNEVFFLKASAQNQNSNNNYNNLNRKNGNKKVNHVHQNHNFEKYFDNDNQQNNNNIFAGLNTRSASELNDQCHLNIDCGSNYHKLWHFALLILIYL
jgi:hypothetical protein